MFPPASSNRSKNSRSRGARTLARRTGRKLALVHVEPGQLDPARRQLADALPDGPGRRLPVVLHAALLQACACPHMTRLAANLADHTELYRCWAAPSPAAAVRDVEKEHRDILEAALARDADRTASVLRAHYQATVNVVLESGLVQGIESPSPIG